MNFYLRVGQEALINEWKTRKKLHSLGMPHFYSFGSHIHRGTRMRFIVLPRYGESIEKMFVKHSYKFHVKTALTLATHILNVLEYVHSQGYVHLDLKGHNMVLGLQPDHAPVYLVDFGLATKYLNQDGTHKEESPDGRKAEAGTMLFSSRDAHKGVITRRSDLESLAYNIVTWLGGRLPWEDCLSNPEQVAERKEKAISNIKVFLNESFAQKPPSSVLGEYLTYVSRMGHDTEPKYDCLRRLFSHGIREAGFLDDSKLTFDNHAKLIKKTGIKRKAESENLLGLKKKKAFIPVIRNPCSNHNYNFSDVRLTRNLDKGPKLRSKEFNWARILAMHPDKIIKKDRINNNDIHYSISKPIVTSNKTYTSNPTPAMIKVMEMSKRRSSTHTSKRSRTDSTSASNGLTPAMEEVLANRMVSTRVLRSHSRRQQQYSK
ncbi:hypothetical protein O3M35_005046 [Rhynocoris fuscipes]|uniref:non-specific serine/threonine protein kinase n=1 Tax=Rhynocoris fuscipes TaxID=488301 RepID=A0AAW1DGU2_9HEMI